MSMQTTVLKQMDSRDCEGLLLLFENASKAWERTNESDKAERADLVYSKIESQYNSKSHKRKFHLEMPRVSPEFIKKAFKKADWWMFDVRQFSAQKRGKMKRGFKQLKRQY